MGDYLYSGEPSQGTNLDHGAIGNGRLIALVAPTGAIEWLCLPRFDSPSVFGNLLDRAKGGSFSFQTGGTERAGKSSYLTNTNVLRTVFDDGATAWELIDFAPRIPEGLGVRSPLALTRLLRPLRGAPRIRAIFDPKADYARAETRITIAEHTIEVSGGPVPMYLRSNIPYPYIVDRHEFTLSEPVAFCLSVERPSGPLSVPGVQRDLDVTVEGWRRWAKTCALPSFEPEAVLRSALCLKLHASQETGAIIAAATTSIPEAAGSGRTWDYRYCWLRDAAFVVEALRRLSHLSEGEEFLRYLLHVAELGPLQPVYGIGGERDLPEQKLEHLSGYDGSSVVRIGNAAAGQRQNDLMGEMVLCLETLYRDPRIVYDDLGPFWRLVERFVEDAIRAAPELDTGIWEFRSLLRPYTFSRAMCWAAIHRGAELAQRTGRFEVAARWSKIAETERHIVISRGYNETKGYFTQALDGHFPDASNLLLPSLGIIDAHDPRFLSTLDNYERELVRNGLMLRYRNPDDFGETTSAFTICSFWWAEALALSGRLDDAISVFRRTLSHANPLGLFSEDIEPETGRMLGNFPQSYAHVGLINAAMTIGDLMDARDGRIRAWM